MSSLVDLAKNNHALAKMDVPQFKAMQIRSIQLLIAQVLLGLLVFTVVASLKRPLPTAALRSYLFIPLIVTMIFTGICAGSATYLLYWPRFTININNN